MSLAEENMGLVKYIAMRYQNLARIRGIEMDDLISEGKIALVRAAQGHTPGRPFAPYAGTAIGRAVRKALRRPVLPTVSLDAFDANFARDTSDPMGGVYARELSSHLRGELQKLSPYERRVVRGAFGFSKETLSEIARERGVSPQAVHKTKERVVKALRHSLEERPWEK